MCSSGWCTNAAGCCRSTTTSRRFRGTTSCRGSTAWKCGSRPGWRGTGCRWGATSSGSPPACASRRSAAATSTSPRRCSRRVRWCWPGRRRHGWDGRHRRRARELFLLANPPGQLHQTHARHHDQPINGDRQEVGRCLALAVAVGHADHVPVRDPRGNAGDGGGGEQPGRGQCAATHRYPRDQFDGQQQREGWPGGDCLADRIRPGIQDVCGDRCGDSEDERGANRPTYAAQVRQGHGGSPLSCPLRTGSQPAVLVHPAWFVFRDQHRVRRVASSGRRWHATVVISTAVRCIAGTVRVNNRTQSDYAVETNARHEQGPAPVEPTPESGEGGS